MAAPRQRNTNAEKADIKTGRIPEHWKDKPAKLRHKDRDARWTLKFTKAKPQEYGTVPAVDLAVPAFGCKNHISIDRRFGLIRRWKATDASVHDGSRLREGSLDRSNTGSPVWADTAYRSAANETWMAKHGFVSKVHHKKPPHRKATCRIWLATRLAATLQDSWSFGSQTPSLRSMRTSFLMRIVKARIAVVIGRWLDVASSSSLSMDGVWIRQ